jgi:hypothetical protein
MDDLSPHHVERGSQQATVGPKAGLKATVRNPQRTKSRALMREAMDRFWTDYYKDAVK